MEHSYKIPYDKTHLTLTLPAPWSAEVIAPATPPLPPDPQRTIEQALDVPLGARRLLDYTGAHSAAIAISDKTRPVPHALLLPPLLARIEALGLPPEAITLIIATGTHLPMPPDDFARVVPPDILARYPVTSHNIDDTANLAYLGETARQTPVWINRRFVEADLRVVVGNIEPHQFMGFSGGAKCAAIGLAGHRTIDHNHAMLSHPDARLGCYDANPMRQDVEDIGEMAGVHFALNSILDRQKRLVTALFGTPRTLMQQGIRQTRAICQVPVTAPFDLLVTAPGGAPKDINLYQAQKAFGHAAPVTKPGGTVILVAACPEGTGSTGYERWILDPEAGLTSHAAVLERFKREGFRIGPHKAFQIARDAQRVRLLLVSEMSEDFTRRLLIEPVPPDRLNDVVAQILAELPRDAHVGVMPMANSTVPML